MNSLVRIDSEGNLQKLEPVHFANEVDELQGYIRKNPTILGDNIVIIAEQLNTGSGKILDILAIEEVKEGVFRPAIVELKNVEADTDALLQVLRYADWALSNYDSVRLYAAQSKTKVREWDNSSVKVIIVAPVIKSELLELSNYIVDSVDFGFLEFGRFKDTAGDLVVLDWQTPSASVGSVTVAQQEWDWDKYETELKMDSNRLTIGRHLFDSLVMLNSENEWGLKPVFRKYYVAFKKSGYNIVEIELFSKQCFFVVQLPKQPKDLELTEIHPELEQDYNGGYHRYWFQIPSTEIAVADFCSYIDKAVELL